MMRNKYFVNRHGFTLIEALFASIILAISLFVIGLTIYTEFAFINQNREKTIATLATQEEIENIRGMPFDTVLALSSSFTASGFSYLKDPVGTVIIDNIFSDNNIRRVSVSVRWTSTTGRTLEKKMVTLVTRNGISRQ